MSCRRSPLIFNDAFVDMFNVPNEVQFNMSYESQMSYVSSLMKDDDAFIEEIHNAETQPTLNTRDLFHSIDGRSLETTSKPITIDGNVLGRIWHFRELSSKDIQSDTTLVIKKRQELLANIISQTIQKRSPKEILTKTLHNLGQVFAVERAFIYQLSRKIPEGISCHWMADSHILNDAEYYNYFQKNPWVWHFYTQPQCNHIEQGENDPAMRINSLLEEMQVKTCLSLPIMTQGRLWGMLLLHSCFQQRTWTADELEFLEMLTNQLAIAIHQYDIDQQLNTSQQKIAATNTIDELTFIPNARKFEQVLEKEWQRLAREKLPITLLRCKIDFFDLYKETYGDELANSCLQQVSWAIALVCQQPVDLVARISEEELGILLPNTDLDGALFIADQILTGVQKLQIANLQSPLNQCVSVSVGINSMVPTLKILPSDLVLSTCMALEQAVQAGGNRINLGEMFDAA